MATSSAVATGTVLTGEPSAGSCTTSSPPVAAGAPHSTDELRNRVHAAVDAPAWARQTRFARLRGRVGGSDDSTAADSADAVVIGAGHNGLVAANLLADAGWDVVVLEATAAPGGAVRSAEVTAPGYLSDLYSSFYPLGYASPVLRRPATWTGTG